LRSLAIVAVLCATARADRPVHGSIGGGTALLLTGDNGDRNRFDLEADLEPHSRWGALVAWRAFDDKHSGIVGAGVIYEAGAARPRLVVDLHGDAGFDLDARAPMVGGGLRTVIAIYGPFGVALEAGGYLVIDGVADTRLQLATGFALVATF
jgi:hypothetical protein